MFGGGILFFLFLYLQGGPQTGLAFLDTLTKQPFEKNYFLIGLLGCILCLITRATRLEILPNGTLVRRRLLLFFIPTFAKRYPPGSFSHVLLRTVGAVRPSNSANPSTRGRVTFVELKGIESLACYQSGSLEQAHAMAQPIAEALGIPIETE